jgi:hypothetical protein
MLENQGEENRLEESGAIEEINNGNDANIRKSGGKEWRRF